MNLGWDDFGARFYDPAIGRFTTQDRFAEKYHPMAPYQYAANNPLLYIDINGDSIIFSQAIQDNSRAMQSYSKFAGTEAGQRFEEEFGAGGKFGEISVVFDVADLKGGKNANTGAFGVDQKTGEETELASENTIKEYEAAGYDMSKYRSSLEEGEFLRFKTTINDITGDVNIDFKTSNRAATINHETQHIRIGVAQVDQKGRLIYSQGQEHRLMRTNTSLFNERFNTMKAVRPDLSDQKIRSAVNAFEDY